MLLIVVYVFLPRPVRGSQGLRLSLAKIRLQVRGRIGKPDLSWVDSKTKVPVRLSLTGTCFLPWNALLANAPARAATVALVVALGLIWLACTIAVTAWSQASID